LEGSERITVRRNVFLNWEGGLENFVKAGNDGRPYHEAEDVLLENNLMIGNAPKPINSAFGVRGAKNVTFTNNTVVGDLPAKAYAYRATITELNPQNENIAFYNNIWADPTGSMGSEVGSSPEFSHGDASETHNLILDNNLYWNGGAEIPPGTPVSPLISDTRRVVADPLLNRDHAGVILPRWTGASFLSGNRYIRQEFERLVYQYGKIPAGSPAIGGADPAFAPTHDIFGRPRTATPDLGAAEYHMQLTGRYQAGAIRLEWTDPHEPNATSLSILYTTGSETQQIRAIPNATRVYTLTNLAPSAVYRIVVTARDDANRLLAQSNQIGVITADAQAYLPITARNRAQYPRNQGRFSQPFRNGN